MCQKSYIVTLSEIVKAKTKTDAICVFCNMLRESDYDVEHIDVLEE